MWIFTAFAGLGLVFMLYALVQFIGESKGSARIQQPISIVDARRISGRLLVMPTRALDSGIPANLSLQRKSGRTPRFIMTHKGELGKHA